jgi:hypothetical protein
MDRHEAFVHLLKCPAPPKECFTCKMAAMHFTKEEHRGEIKIKEEEKKDG